MTTADSTRADLTSDSYTGATARESGADTSGAGWVLFAGIMLLMVGTMNVIDGIAAISNSTWSLIGTLRTRCDFGAPNASSV
jgi:hypothetical protein